MGSAGSRELGKNTDADAAALHFVGELGFMRHVAEGSDVPGFLTGKRCFITGANSGVGFQTSLTMARLGAHVQMGCRDKGRGEVALAKLLEEVPGASAELCMIDLGSSSSIKDCAAKLCTDDAKGPLTKVFFNAGIMNCAEGTTEDGLELQCVSFFGGGRNWADYFFWKK